jgi:hypothetical protein
MRRVSARTLRRALNLWPPFLFAGIRVADIGDDFRHARVELRMRPWNRNYVGTHFGGSLFAMTDPFWMLLVMNAIGDDHIVAGDAEAGFEQFLEMLRRNRDFHDALPKKALIDAFRVVEDEDLVGRYRRKMSSLLLV